MIRNEDVHKEIKKKLYGKEAQYTDITSSIIKENADIFANFLCLNYDKIVVDCVLPASIINATFSPIYKNDSRLEERTIVQLLFSLIFQKVTRE